VGAEYDRGVLSGDCLAHDCLLFGAAAAAARPVVCGETNIATIMRGSGYSAATRR
jgi:hypothetical protein